MEKDPSAVQEFVAELKRRRVVRVFVIYVAAMFALLQAADIMLPALGLPDSVMRLIVITALVGLPIAITLWIEGLRGVEADQPSALGFAADADGITVGDSELSSARECKRIFPLEKRCNERESNDNS